jgi:hypothetical protein
MGNWLSLPVVPVPLPCTGLWILSALRFSLINELAAINVDYGQRIFRALQDHLKETKISMEQGLMTLDNTDNQHARSTMRKAGRRLSKKVTGTQNERLMGISKTTSGANRPVQGDTVTNREGTLLCCSSS